MTQRHEVDGSFFVFPKDWTITKVDEWSEQHRATAKPINAKACDLVAFHDGVAWLIEAKDFSYPEAKVPKDLYEKVAKKAWDTLALLKVVALWGSGERQLLSEQILGCSEMRLCLAVELPDHGRREELVAPALTGMLTELKRMTKVMGVAKPIVSNSFVHNGVPWTVQRNPERRELYLRP